MNEAQQLTLPWPVVSSVIIGTVSFTIFVLTNWWNGNVSGWLVVVMSSQRHTRQSRSTRNSPT